MAERIWETTVERTLDAPRDVVWALVADTNRWNRAQGLAPGKYEWRDVDGKRSYVATAKELGQTLVWVEPPYQWSEGWFIEGERRFLSGPVARAGLRTYLEDAGDHKTRAVITSYVTGTTTLAALLVPWLVKPRMRGAMTRYLDAITGALSRGVESIGDVRDPAVVRARRSLLAGYDAVTSGPRTPSNAAELAHRGERFLRDAPVDRAVGEHLIAFLRDRPDEDLGQIRPFELARAWNVPKPDVLRAFLHATRSGLVDLRWQVNCPVCRVSAQVAGTLADVRNQVHCAACNIDYGVDFGAQVEAVFQCSSAIRSVTPALYCSSSPAFRPHVIAQVTAAPGETREVKATLPPGHLHVRIQGARGGSDGESQGGGVTIEITDDGVTLAPNAEGAGITLVSSAKTPRTLLVERAGWSAEAVLGSTVASFPDFLDLFATEAPATGVELAISHLAVLFSDLTGSTALYERVGDARAFAIVEEHFRAMEKAVVDHGGAVVKTMGDAVMATFPGVEDAVRAAIAMIEANEQLHAPIGLGVKIGVHGGACLAVRANERLDFFGTTVNVSARLQAQAKPAELVVTRDVSSHPGVAALLSGKPRRDFDAALKGIAAMQQLVGVDLRPPAAKVKAAE